MTDILRSDKKGLETIQQFRQKGSDTEIIGMFGGGSECGSWNLSSDTCLRFRVAVSDQGYRT